MTMKRQLITMRMQLMKMMMKMMEKMMMNKIMMIIKQKQKACHGSIAKLPITGWNVIQMLYKIYIALRHKYTNIHCTPAQIYKYTNI